MQNTSLSFTELERRVAEYCPPEAIISKNKSDRIAFWVGLSGGLIAFTAKYFFPPSYATWVLLLGGLIEIVALGVFFISTVKQEIPGFKNAKLNLANDLEYDYDHYKKLISWLRTTPLDDVRKRLRYIQTRRETMHQRFGLLVGGMERLGLLPILVALYFQFKDFHFPVSFDLLNTILAILLVAFYLVSWWLAGLKLRLDLYAQILGDALDDDLHKKPRSL